MSLMKRKASFSVGFPSKARAIATVARAGYRAYKKYKGNGSSSKAQKAVETGPLTDQRDVITTYRKRRMGRRRRKRYVRQLRRWKSNQLRLSPSRIFQYVDADNITWSANTSRYFGAFMGLCSQNNYDNNFGEAWGNITSGTADVKAEASMFRLDHQSLRIVLRNTTTTAAVTATPTIDVDVYKVVCIKDVPSDLWVSGVGVEVFLANQKNQLRQATGMDIEVGTTGTGIATAQQNAGNSFATQVVGDSLFNNPMFLRYFKILKCYKIQLGSNNMTELSWRDSKNRVIKREECFGTAGISCKRGVTKGYIFNVNGRAHYPTATVEFISGSMVLEQYVRYNVKCIEGTAPTLVYDGA